MRHQMVALEVVTRHGPKEQRVKRFPGIVVVLRAKHWDMLVGVRWGEDKRVEEG